MDVRVIYKIGTKEQPVDIWMTKGSTVYGCLMQAKSQGLIVPDEREVQLEGRLIPADREQTTRVYRKSTIVVRDKVPEGTETVFVD